MSDEVIDISSKAHSLWEKVSSYMYIDFCMCTVYVKNVNAVTLRLPYHTLCLPYYTLCLLKGVRELYIHTLLYIRKAVLLCL